MNGGFFMIYLDYAANTPVNQKVLDAFNNATLAKLLQIIFIQRKKTLFIQVVQVNQII